MHLIILVLLTMCTCAFGQCHRFMFYNAENLFDTINDPCTNDDEFTPGGDKHWTEFRYQQKLTNLIKVFMACGQDGPPELIGLCEIENKKVLHDLCNHALFSRFKYEMVHYDSPDRRGIDVALLYSPASFRVLQSRPVHVAGKVGFLTRDILYVKGILNQNRDTAHLLICHFPSRWGGVASSEPRRKAVSKVLQAVIDSIYKSDLVPGIIIAGDFNDGPKDASIFNITATYNMVNLSNQWVTNNYYTHYYKGAWYMFDQVLVSRPVLAASNCNPTPRMNIYWSPFW
ncbi:MAG: hypothetical protein HC896_01410 [Bacteroidales bacterium]|nr:hypothetical protein [Bacteroidales bacterium]